MKAYVLTSTPCCLQLCSRSSPCSASTRPPSWRFLLACCRQGYSHRDAMKKCNILIQALFAAVADVHVYALAIRLFGRDPNDKAKPVVSIGRWALLFQLASWSAFPPPPKRFKTQLHSGSISMRLFAPSATRWRPLSLSCACNAHHPQMQNCNTLHEHPSAFSL